MGKFLDDLIGIRNRAIGDVDGSRNRSKPVEIARNKTRFTEAKSKPKKKTFSAWMSEVEDEIEAVTGMDMDVFADLPWGKFFKDRYSPQEAVQEGLRQAEEDDDDSDAISFREWSERVDRGLKKAGKPILSRIREEKDLSSSEIHQLFMDNRNPKKAVEVLSDLYEEEEDEEVEDEEEKIETSILRHRGHTSRGTPMSSLEEWMRAIDEAKPVYGEETEEVPKPDFIAERKRPVIDEMDPADYLTEDDLHSSVSVGIQACVTPASMPIKPPSVSDVMSSIPSVESLMNSATHKSAPVESKVSNAPSDQLSDMANSLIKKGEDDDLLEGINEILPTDPDDVDFDIVGAALGTSDIGRTLPTVQTKAFGFSKFISAMKAAEDVRASLAKVISEEEGARYIFNKNSGDPSQSDGRSLWFEFCPPEKSEKKKYFLCLSYNDTVGESEDGIPKVLWDVSLRKGDTRDDSEEVVSDSGIEEEALKSVVGAIPSCFVD
jgi:hypothetical protein